MAESDGSWPEASFPKEEAALLQSVYSSAQVILEYGSGWSTVHASEAAAKLIFSVESDRKWAIRLQKEIDIRSLPSAALVYHVDIGPTGDWGRPLNAERWTQFHRYPMAIWDEPFFRQPDVVLIDGRFRPACLMTVLLRTLKPVKVLFDDYVGRPAYHSVEKFVTPTDIFGRMAVFEVVPGALTSSKTSAVIDHFFRATYHGQASGLYGVPAKPEGRN